MGDSLSMAIKATIARSTGSPMKVFDWTKAKTLIKAYEKEWGEAIMAEAYLRSDEGNTVGIIYYDGRIVLNEHPYTSSIWATPMLRIMAIDAESEHTIDIECYYEMEDRDKADALATKVWPNIW